MNHRTWTFIVYICFVISAHACHKSTTIVQDTENGGRHRDAAASDGSGPDLDTDSDTDSDSDTDTDTDSDTDSDQEPCWCDTATGLCWQNPPDDIQMNWYTASGKKNDEYNPEGVPGYCEYNEWGGYNDWRLPDIDELISLIRGCVDGKVTGDLSTSICGVEDPDCLDYYCHDKNNCSGCSYLRGPCEDGCYWHPEIEGKCSWYWSSSIVFVYGEEWGSTAWGVNFNYGDLDSENKSDERRVRCVRPCP